MGDEARGAGEGVLDFDNYVRSNLAGWDEATNTVDGRRWADMAFQCMKPQREIEQEPNMPVAHIAREFGIRGPAYNCLTACAASTQAVGEAFRLISRGDADYMLAGGADSRIDLGALRARK